MKYEGKREILFCNEGLPIKIGYSLGTVYEAKWDSDYRHISYKLYNFGYCPADKDFYYNGNIHLPKNLIEYFENGIMSAKKEEELHELGIYHVSYSEYLSDKYNEEKAQNEIAKQKILNLSKTIKNKSKRNSK